MVYGRDPVGLYGLLSRLVSVLPFFLDFGLEQCIQPIHISELCVAIERVISIPKLAAKQFNLGLVRGISFKNFLRDCARFRFHKKLFYIPTPYWLIRSGCFLTHWVPFVPNISIDCVRGLLALQFMETERSLIDLHLTLQEPSYFFMREASVLPSLEQEADALFRYLGCQTPAEQIKARYAMIILQQDPSAVLMLPRLFLKWPWLFRFFEPLGDALMLKRVNLACSLLEAEVATAPLFWNLKKRSKLALYFYLLGLTFIEAMGMVFRLSSAALKKWHM